MSAASLEKSFQKQGGVRSYQNDEIFVIAF
jgi:hypothetical protein